MKGCSSYTADSTMDLEASVGPLVWSGTSRVGGRATSIAALVTSTVQYMLVTARDWVKLLIVR